MFSLQCLYPELSDSPFDFKFSCNTVKEENAAFDILEIVVYSIMQKTYFMMSTTCFMMSKTYFMMSKTYFMMSKTYFMISKRTSWCQKRTSWCQNLLHDVKNLLHGVKNVLHDVKNFIFNSKSSKTETNTVKLFKMHLILLPKDSIIHCCLVFDEVFKIFSFCYQLFP